MKKTILKRKRLSGVLCGLLILCLPLIASAEEPSGSVVVSGKDASTARPEILHKDYPHFDGSRHAFR